MDPLEWQFSIFDRVSKPAGDMAKGIDSVTTAADSATPAVDKLDETIAKGGTALDKVRGSHDKLAPALDKTTKTTNESAVATLKAQIATAKLSLEAPRLQKQLASLQKEMNPDKPKKFGVEFGNLFHTIAGFRSNDQGGLTFNIAEGIQSAVGAVERLASAFGQLTGKALEVAAAGEKATRATTLNLGATGGRDLLTYLDQVRDKSRGLYTQEQLRGLAAPLAQHGIGLPDIKRFLPAALSVEQRGGSAAGALGALGDIRTNRSISAGTLESLGLGSFADKQKIAQQLGSQFGFGGGYAKKNPEAVLGAVSERLQYQPQKADQVVKTLLAALAGREKGGVLGGDAAGAQTGTAATLQRLQNLPQTLYEKLTTNGQLDNLVNSLDRFVNIIGGPEGKSAIDSLAKLVDVLASFIHVTGNIVSDKVTNGTLNERGQRQISQLDFDPKHDELSLTARIDKWLGRNAGPTTPAASDALPQSPAVAGAAKDQGKDLGKDIASGLVEGLLLSKASEDAMSTLMDRTFTAGESEAEIHSPSRRARRGGRFIGMGLALGLGDTQSQIDRAMDQAFAIDDVAGASRYNGGGAAGGALGGTGGGMTLQIAAGAIRIDGTGMSAEDVAAEVLRQIEEKAPGSMISIAEQLSDELGGG